jgi:hypothetical protein
MKILKWGGPWTPFIKKLVWNISFLLAVFSSLYFISNPRNGEQNFNHEVTHRQEALPALKNWYPSKGVKLKHTQDLGLIVTGNDGIFNYQIKSPAINVKGWKTISIQFPIEVRSGNLTVGFLDETRSNWILKPMSLLLNGSGLTA